MHAAFVLLSESWAPDAAALASGWRSVSSVAPFEAAPDRGTEVACLEGALGTFFVTLVPVPVPKGEAESAARFSIGYLGQPPPCAPHAAHLIVAFTPHEELSATEQANAFTKILGAVLIASRGTAAYWGAAKATHPAELVIAAAKSDEWAMSVWSGISIARPPPGDRLSMLSTGMGQFGLRDLLMTAPVKSGDDALECFFTFLRYVARRGEDVPEGHTIGRTAEEKLRVKYEPSPFDAKKSVFRVDLP